MPKQPRMSAEQRRWATASDLSTLTEAEVIRRDKARLAAAKKLAREQTKALGEIQDLGR